MTHQPIYGNYHGYYTKRANGACGDTRLAVLPRALFKERRVLDIGCNEGVVTIEIAQRYAPSRIVGVDIDEHLIRLAWKRRRTSWSLQSTSPPAGDSALPSSSQPKTDQATDMSKKRKRHPSLPAPTTQSQPCMTSEQEVHAYNTRIEPDLFPAAFEYVFGPIAFPPTTPQWPNNVAFYRTDWTKDQPEESFLKRENEEGWDVILAFSITKWIHLHGGDDGLLEFFRRIYRLLRPGGIFVLEPQEWEGYKKAKRVDRKLAENARLLKLRPEMFEEELEKIGLTLEEAYGTPGEGGMYPTLYIQVHSTLTAKQALNDLSPKWSQLYYIRKGDNRKGGRQVLADQELPSL